MHDSLSQAVTKLQDTLQCHEGRFAKIKLILRGIQHGSASPPDVNTFANLESKISALERTVVNLQDKQWHTSFLAVPQLHQVTWR
jgi:hypothetical protein